MGHLTEYLSSRKLTQAAFARTIGVNQATISKLCDETRRPRISPEMAVRIENATGGLVPVESWPNFQPLLHRAAPTDGDARNRFLPDGHNAGTGPIVSQAGTFANGVGNSDGGAA